jgi:hypothetical protein
MNALNEMNRVAYNTSIHNKARFGTNLSPMVTYINNNEHVQ